MEEVKRWGVAYYSDHEQMEEFEDGSYVLYTDYAALKARVVELEGLLLIALDKSEPLG